jgi:hypothetical protein
MKIARSALLSAIEIAAARRPAFRRGGRGVIDSKALSHESTL